MDKLKEIQSKIAEMKKEQLLLEEQAANIIDGKGCLKYETQKIQNAIVETIELDMNEETGCGDLSFDIRVYDRDRSSIEGLINRGLKDPISGRYLTQLEAKQLLNKL